MTVKFVGRKAPRIYRLARVMWCKGKVGDGRGYSAKLSFAFVPRIFSVQRAWHEFECTMFCLRVHYKRSYGGRFA